MTKCEKWLQELLQNEDCLPIEEVKEQAVKNNFSKQELKNARKTLGVKTFHQFDDGLQTENWFWYIDK